MNIVEFIKPELLILVPVMYLVGMALKRSEFLSDNKIPLVLGAISILLSALYVFQDTSFAVEGVFMAVTQGILVAGASVYCNQLYKQSNKDE